MAEASAVAIWQPSKSKDKIYIMMLVAAGVSGLWLSLQSAGYLLAFNVNTLMISCMIFTLTSANYIVNAKPWQMQIQYAALAIIPIALRWLLNLPFFQSYTPQHASMLDVMAQILFALQVIALWTIVAVAEESFRATMMNVWEGIYRLKNRQTNTIAKVMFANALWVLFHFIQRPFDPVAYKWYIVWLAASGVVLGLVLEKAGLGAAALAHFMVNLTA